MVRQWLRPQRFHLVAGTRTGAATLRARAVFTNTMPTNAYRSSGRPEVTFAIERLLDVAAHELGMDRISLRRKNLIRPSAMPYRNAVGMKYDSGTYEANMDFAMQIADVEGFKQRRREAKSKGKPPPRANRMWSFRDDLQRLIEALRERLPRPPVPIRDVLVLLR